MGCHCRAGYIAISREADKNEESGVWAEKDSVISVQRRTFGGARKPFIPAGYAVRWKDHSGRIVRRKLNKKIGGM